jgi:hypothetical protein
MEMQQQPILQLTRVNATKYAIRKLEKTRANIFVNFNTRVYFYDPSSGNWILVRVGEKIPHECLLEKEKAESEFALFGESAEVIKEV